MYITMKHVIIKTSNDVKTTNPIELAFFLTFAIDPFVSKFILPLISHKLFCHYQVTNSSSMYKFFRHDD